MNFGGYKLRKTNCVFVIGCIRGINVTIVTSWQHKTVDADGLLM